MGFSVSGATVVIFIGTLIAVGTLVPAVAETHQRLDAAVTERDDRSLLQRNSDIAVDAVTYDNGTLTVVVENTGANALDADDTDLLVDGIYRSDAAGTVEGDGGRNVWTPGDRLVFELTDLPGRPDRVKVVAQTGVAETETGV